jgi:hypothetical protein
VGSVLGSFRESIDGLGIEMMELVVGRMAKRNL